MNSCDISEEVTAIEWLNNSNTEKPLMLTQNSKVIKLWKIQDKVTKKHESCRKMLSKGKGIIFPKTKTSIEGKMSKLVTTFKTGKEHHLHSLSQSADNENFLAADDSCINLFNLRRSNDKIFNMVDLERNKQSQEQITSARFNQTQGTVFLYTTSTGKINVCDFRENSDFHKKPSIVFDSAQKTLGGKASVFNKWTNSVSDARFIEGNHQVVSRDYLNVKLWDLRAASTAGVCSKPIYSAQVTDYMERNLTSLMD